MATIAKIRQSLIIMVGTVQAPTICYYLQKKYIAVEFEPALNLNLRYGATLNIEKKDKTFKHMQSIE